MNAQNCLNIVNAYGRENGHSENWIVAGPSATVTPQQYEEARARLDQINAAEREAERQAEIQARMQRELRIDAVENEIQAEIMRVGTGNLFDHLIDRRFHHAERAIESEIKMKSINRDIAALEKQIKCQRGEKKYVTSCQIITKKQKAKRAAEKHSHHVIKHARYINWLKEIDDTGSIAFHLGNDPKYDNFKYAKKFLHFVDKL